MTASSRIFGITIDGVKTDAFVPLADMLNHRRPKQTSWMYDNEAKGFVIEALDDIPKGSQIFDSYGRKCNSRFFMNYGFIVDKNDADEVAIQMRYDSNDPLLDLKKELTGTDAESKSIRVMADLEEQCASDLFSHLRFIVLRDKSKLLMLSEAKDHNDQDTFFTFFKPKKTPPLSLENEFAMIERVKKVCEDQLKLYLTSLEEDEKRINNDEEQLSTNERNCIMLRMGEKSILRFYISFADKVLPLFKLRFKDVRKVIFSPELISCNEYVKKCIVPLMLKEESGAK